MSASLIAVLSLLGFAVFMIAFTLVPIVVILLACLALFGSSLSRRGSVRPAAADAEQVGNDGQ